MPIPRHEWFHLDGQGALHAQVYRAVRGAILSGRVPPGSRLPSTRALARDLRVSRNTACEAYDQLTAEGYIEGRRGSGTYACRGLGTDQGVRPVRTVGAAGAGSDAPPSGGPPRLSAWGHRLATGSFDYPYDVFADLPPAEIDFVYGVAEPDGLPLDLLRRLHGREALRADSRALSYAPPQGEPVLRAAIAGHLARHRGVDCSPDQVLVVAGIQQGIALAVRVLLDAGDAVLVEDPLYDGARFAFEAANLELVPAAVDDEGCDSATVAPAALSRCRMAYLTPSHQFPRGSVLSLRRRLGLLDWAQSTGAWLFEDDYDGAFRYAGRPIESLKALDADDRVIYAGTFSKTLFPALRLGYLVLPSALLRPFRTARWLSDWTSPSLPQRAIAAMIDEGEYDRHLRRCRTRYGRRRSVLVEELRSRFGDSVLIHGADAGLHLLIELVDRPADAVMPLVLAARQAGVGVYPAFQYAVARPARCSLLMSWTLVDVDAIREGVRRLAEVAL